jgi:adenylate kinase family enzyme
MKLTMLVGPPGSGKSTLRAKLKTNTEFYHISQDEMGKEGHWKNFEILIQDKDDIIVDRMNFNKQQRDRYLKPAKEAGYETEIIVLHQNYETCLERCLKRESHETIKDEVSAKQALGLFFSKYERVQDDEADKVTRIWPEGQKPSAIVCDLDGTLCNVDDRLHFVRREGKKDWKSFFDGIPNDSVNRWCADILKAMSKDHTIVYCSGRPDTYRKQTVQWLKDNDLFSFENGGPNYDFHLYMRHRNDQRQDNIVKENILDFEILTRFTPYFMIDDRAQVVQMWRRRGFTCLACAEGDF